MGVGVVVGEAAFLATLLFPPSAPGSVPPPSSLPAHLSPVAFLLDVAGQDESRLHPGDLTPLANPGRDSTVLSIVQVDLSSLASLGSPTYRALQRFHWLGRSHLDIFALVKSLAASWSPQHLVIDATGVGEGLWTLLDRSFPSRVIPVRFSQSLKSEIGWRFLAIIETGRFRDSSPSDLVRSQYAACRMEILPGPGRFLRWGVPQGLRSPQGDLLHDDFILADSLVALLDRLEWHINFPTIIIPPPFDLLEQMSRNFGTPGLE